MASSPPSFCEVHLSLSLEVNIMIFLFFLLDFHLLHRGRAYPFGASVGASALATSSKQELSASEASLSAVAINSEMPGSRTLLPSPFAFTFCFSCWAIHFKPEKLMANPVGADRDIQYRWQNPKVINRFGVLNGMHNHTSVQLAIKYCQARAPSIKLPMKARLVFGLPT